LTPPTPSGGPAGPQVSRRVGFGDLRSGKWQGQETLPQLGSSGQSVRQTACPASWRRDPPASAWQSHRVQRPSFHVLRDRDYKSNKSSRWSIGLPSISFHCVFWASVSRASIVASRLSRILITLGWIFLGLPLFCASSSSG